MEKTLWFPDRVKHLFSHKAPISANGNTELCSDLDYNDPSHLCTHTASGFQQNPDTGLKPPNSRPQSVITCPGKNLEHSYTHNKLAFSLRILSFLYSFPELTS